jgi:hypothetical protein
MPRKDLFSVYFAEHTEFATTRTITELLEQSIHVLKSGPREPKDIDIELKILKKLVKRLNSIESNDLEESENILTGDPIRGAHIYITPLEVASLFYGAIRCYKFISIGLFDFEDQKLTDWHLKEMKGMANYMMMLVGDYVHDYGMEKYETVLEEMERVFFEAFPEPSFTVIDMEPEE